MCVAQSSEKNAQYASPTHVWTVIEVSTYNTLTVSVWYCSYHSDTTSQSRGILRNSSGVAGQPPKLTGWWRLRPSNFDAGFRSAAAICKHTNNHKQCIHMHTKISRPQQSVCRSASVAAVLGKSRFGAAASGRTTGLKAPQSNTHPLPSISIY